MNDPWLFAVSETIWDLKYRYRLGNAIIDQNIEDTWVRVAKACAQTETKTQRKHWSQAFYDILEGFQFIPGGRILAGAGTKHKVTLFNCFVMDIKEDSLRGIFNALEEGALTLQQGGGVGYDFSVLRPHGDLIKKTGLSSSGPVSFMHIWDTTCGILLSTGARRGAMMGVMRCDHPDVVEFIEAKRDPSALRHFNVSILITDDFMTAVKEDRSWPLVFPTDAAKQEGEMVYRQWGDSLLPVPCRVYYRLPARELWNKIIQSAYAYAEPGVLFVDTINRFNNLYYREQIHATNPCGEIPLPAYGACNLGAINLTQFVTHAFTPQAQLDWIKLEEVVSIAVRLQDNVINISHYPLPAQRRQAVGSRRIGLGLTGLADTLILLNMTYGSPESLQFAEKVMRKIAEVSWLTSIELAQEKGPCPFFKPEFLRGEFVKTLSDHIRKRLSFYGVRNSHHNTIAPTGTTSLVANNVSNGIEPIFKAKYARHVRRADGSSMTFNVESYAAKIWQDQGNTGLPPHFIDTHQLTPQAHLGMQASMQPYVDNAISKTINLPADFPFESLANVYTQAYLLHLKGCTIFRPNFITGSVLEAQNDEDDALDRCCQID